MSTQEIPSLDEALEFARASIRDATGISMELLAPRAIIRAEALGMERLTAEGLIPHVAPLVAAQLGPRAVVKAELTDYANHWSIAVEAGGTWENISASRMAGMTPQAIADHLCAAMLETLRQAVQARATAQQALDDAEAASASGIALARAFKSL